MSGNQYIRKHVVHPINSYTFRSDKQNAKIKGTEYTKNMIYIDNCTNLFCTGQVWT